MSTTHAVHCSPTAAPVLYVAFGLSWTTWKMAFTVGAGQPPRIRTVPARCIRPAHFASGLLAPPAVC